MIIGSVVKLLSFDVTSIYRTVVCVCWRNDVAADVHNVVGHALIWADVIWSPDVTVVSDAGAAAADAAALHARWLSRPVNRFLDDVLAKPGLTPVLFYLVYEDDRPVVAPMCLSITRKLF